MAVDIIDCLETVEVEQHHGEVQFLATRPKNRQFEPVGKQGAIGESGQRVVQCEAAGVIQFFAERPRVPLEHEIGPDELTDPILSGTQGRVGRVQTRQHFRNFRERWPHVGRARNMRLIRRRQAGRIAAGLHHARGRIVRKVMAHRLEATTFILLRARSKPIATNTSRISYNATVSGDKRRSMLGGIVKCLPAMRSPSRAVRPSIGGGWRQVFLKGLATRDELE